MFMVKDEFENTLKLLNVKIKSARKSFIWVIAVAACMVLLDIIPEIIIIARNGRVGVTAHNITDYSLTLFFGLAVCFFVMMFCYRQTNGYLSVFPQTNTSRFIASQLMNCIILIMAGLIALAMYLADFAAVKLTSSFYNNVYFALNFNISFIIAGFLTFIVYGLIVIAAFGLIGAILRKWTYYAVAVFVIDFSFAVVNIRTVIDYTPMMLSPLVGEASPVMFMVKGLGLCLVLTAISLIINYYTVYYKSQRKLLSTGIIVSCVIVAATIIVGSSLFLLNASAGGDNVVVNKIQTLSEDEYFAHFDGIGIDVSHLPKGSKLKTEGVNVIFPEPLDSYTTTDYNLLVNGTDALNSLQGDTIFVMYKFPTLDVNGCEVFKYANPKLNAYLDGDTVHIEYTFENNHVVIIPVWSFAGQFDCFKDKNLLPKNAFGFRSGGSGGHISLKVE